VGEINSFGKIRRNKMIYLITGGTGTFGRALLGRLLNSDATEIRIFSRDESKQHEMKQEIKDNRVTYWIGDVRNPESLIEVMQGVDYVFHAAAMKHVWSCEEFPMESIATNVIGTANVIEAAIRAKVYKFILLSSDKAVYPVGVMGACKFLAEKVMLSKAKGKTILCGVRFGNLIDSRGSVLGVWRKQIAAGQACTLTDPNATRFIMSLDQAMDLVEYMIDEGKQGEIKVYEAKTCTVRELYMAVSGNKNSYKFIGLQPGEKMHEYLTEDLSSETAERFTYDELKEMI
jgi:UDP-N-acetylglucosamine 4,6-dehydratase/5-epimerase